MNAVTLQTKNLNLVEMTREEALAMVEALSPEERKHVSDDWLAQVHAAASDDPWTFGFTMIVRETGVRVGTCGFNGPADADGVVEIAYGVDEEHQGKGYATEAAEALVEFAFESGMVLLVCAHTFPEKNASGRVLKKCGFRFVGEVDDPEEGLVWRWERQRDEAY